MAENDKPDGKFDAGQTPQKRGASHARARARDGEKRDGPGRQTVMTPETREELITLIAGGMTAAKAIEKLHVGKSSFDRLMARDAGFASDIRNARKAGAAWRLEEAGDGLREAKDAVDVQRRREVAAHERWLASKQLDEFADRPTVAMQVNNNVTAPPLQEQDRRRIILETGRGMAYFITQAGQVARASDGMLIEAGEAARPATALTIDAEAEPAPAADPAATPAEQAALEEERQRAADQRHADRQFEAEVQREINRRDVPQVIRGPRYPRYRRP